MSLRVGEVDTGTPRAVPAGGEPGRPARALGILLLIQAGAALLLGAFALAQEAPRLPPPLDAAGSLGRTGSVALYALAAAVSLGAALAPGFRRALGAPFHARARPLLGALAVCAGLPASAVLLFHAAAGDVWWSARVTPFRHSAPFPYLLGAAALAAAVFLGLALGEAILERALEGRPGALRAARRLVLLAFALACGFILVETGLRVHAVVAPRTDGLGVTPGAHLWIRRHVRSNRAGFRDEDFAPRAPGELLACVLGDSLIHGYGIEGEEDRATERLQALLARSAGPLAGFAPDRRRARVLNVALPGAGTRRQFEWLKGVVLPLSPDLVILGHFWNDIQGSDAPGEPGPVEDDGTEGRDAGRRHTFRRLVRVWIQSQSAVGAEILRARLMMRLRRTDPAEPILRAYADARTYARHLDMLQAMHGAAAERGVRFAVLLLPDFGYPFAESPYAAVATRMEHDLGKRGVPAFALVRLVPPPFPGGKDLWVNPGDSHPNESGHAYIGDGLHRVVMELAGRALSGSPR